MANKTSNFWLMLILIVGGIMTAGCSNSGSNQNAAKSNIEKTASSQKEKSSTTPEAKKAVSASPELKQAILRQLAILKYNVMMLETSDLDNVANCVAKKVSDPKDSQFKETVKNCADVQL